MDSEKVDENLLDVRPPPEINTMEVPSKSIPATNIIELTEENKETSKFLYLIIFFILIVTQKISEVFDVLTKYETEFPEKDEKFWQEISEFKEPLGDILDESKSINNENI